jgi:hypothetical protein
MADMQAPAPKAANAKSSINWPVWVAGLATVAFVVGVWVNNYRVSHAVAKPLPVVSTK